MGRYTENDITIVICAYKECSYLEACIKSVINQTVKCKVIVSTSTPNDYIKGLADKYGLEIRVNENGGHANDYNFALKQCDTLLCAMAHQDDLLNERFVEKSIEYINKSKDPIIAFTDYLEIHNDVIDNQPSKLIRVKKKLLLPLKIKGMGDTVFGKRLIQCFGNPISHPTVTYVLAKMPDICFRNEYRADMDWDFWERLSKNKGTFVYVDEVLHYHRIHSEQATARLVNDSSDDPRYCEDYEMFSRFWPKWMAKLIMKAYSKSQGVYSS